MNFISGVAKLMIIVFGLCILLLAANRHGKEWKGRINFWAALAIVGANYVALTFGGFFNGFINFGV